MVNTEIWGEKKDTECQKKKCNQWRVYDDDDESLPYFIMLIDGVEDD